MLNSDLGTGKHQLVDSCCPNTLLALQLLSLLFTLNGLVATKFILKKQTHPRDGDGSL